MVAVPRLGDATRKFGGELHVVVRSGTGHSTVICFTHRWLLASVSAIAMFAVATPAHARPLGGGTATQSAATIAAAQSAQIEAQRAAREAGGALKRATLAVQAMQAAQKAARDAALAAPGGVPNGLVAGGLQVAPGAVPGSNLWLGAKLPTESVSGGRSDVSIEQTQQKAILTWQTFNVGRDTALYFDQRAGGASAGDWIALNRVLDPSAAPSKILGSINAEGQVYIVNRNGIIFGGSSQVNVGTLVASSLTLTNQQFLSGINTSQTYDPLGNGSIDLRPTFGDVPTTTNVNAVPPAPAGNVTVAAGAQIKSGKNGLIGLFGTNVTNSGTLSSDGGQVLMAAGEQVWLVPQLTDSGMIGMRAYVSALPNFYTTAIDDPVLFQKLAARTAQVGMVARNEGLVEVTAGNIGIVGSTVQQNGIARAITTLDSPGSIMIAGEDSTLSNYFGTIKRRGGTVVFGENSVTQIVVDGSGTVGTGGSAGDSSMLRISGLTVELKGKASAGANELTGAYVQSQAGKIDIDLRGTEYAFAILNEGFQVQPQAPVAGNRFLMAGGATLDASGMKDAEVPIERNSVAVEVRANELRDSPLLRGGFLVAKTVYVDRRLSGTRADGTTWRGSPLIDANDYIANVPTSMAERAVKGGSITIHANEVVINPAARLDISGGSIRYLDGNVRTTRLLAANGVVYDIGSAPTDLQYVALAGGFSRISARWNIVETWTSPLGKSNDFHFEKGYSQGANGGLLEVHAPAQVWDGEITAGVLTGERQISSPAVGGTLKIGSTSIPDSNFHANNLLFQKESEALPDGFSMSSALPAKRKSTLVLSTDMLNESGLAKLDLNVNGDITFASSTDLHLAPGSSVKVIGYLTGKSVVVDGSIRLPGGAFYLSGKGAVTVKSNAIIDVSGLWTNNLVSGLSTPVAVNGGSIDLTGAMIFETGSVLDVSAGAWLSSARKLKLGSAGSITISARNANLDLGRVTLRGYGVATGSEAVVPAGGALTLNLASIAIAASGSATGNAIRLDLCVPKTLSGFIE
jgi:filamentous hemagglutinin